MKELTTISPDKLNKSKTDSQGPAASPAIRKLKGFRYNLKNFGLCYSPSSINFEKVVLLDGDCIQYRFTTGKQQQCIQSPWTFIDPRNRKNFRLLMKCDKDKYLTSLELQDDLNDELARIKEQFKHYCIFK